MSLRVLTTKADFWVFSEKKSSISLRYMQWTDLKDRAPNHRALQHQIGISHYTPKGGYWKLKWNMGYYLTNKGYWDIELSEIGILQGWKLKNLLDLSFGKVLNKSSCLISFPLVHWKKVLFIVAILLGLPWSRLMGTFPSDNHPDSSTCPAGMEIIGYRIYWALLRRTGLKNFVMARDIMGSKRGRCINCKFQIFTFRLFTSTDHFA